MEQDRSNFQYWLIFIGIMIVGANLRAPLTSVGTVISFIRVDLDLSHTLAGLITTLPLMAFALVSPFAPKLSEKFGMERTILYSLIVLCIGIVFRSMFGAGMLFFGTLLIGLAIAIGNVLIPVIIKLNFPFRVGIVMGFYAVGMNVFGAIGSGITVPLMEFKAMGWQGSLQIWAVLALLATVMWLPQLKVKRESLDITEAKKRDTPIWKSAIAWYITIFMGLQSLMFYTLITWLPDILHLHGYEPAAAGWLLFLMQVALIPITFVVPIIAEKMKDQRLLGAVIASFFIVSVVLIMLGIKPLIPVAMILLGIACGSAFSLCMMLFSLRTSNGTEAAKMSGMAQSFGYLLAASGPAIFGALHDLTGGWTAPLILLVIAGFGILFTAVQAGRNRVISYV